MTRSINFVLAEKNGQKEKRKIGRTSLKYMSKNKTLLMKSNTNLQTI